MSLYQLLVRSIAINHDILPSPVFPFLSEPCILWTLRLHFVFAAVQVSSPPSPQTANLAYTPYVSTVEAPGAVNSPPATAPPPPTTKAAIQAPEGSPLPAVGTSSPSPSPPVPATQASKEQLSPDVSSPVPTPEELTPKYAPPEGDFSLNMQDKYPIRQAVYSPPSMPAHAADSPPPAVSASPSPSNRRLLTRNTRK